MASVLKLRQFAVAPTGTHRASLIFLHGSGDTGQGVRSWIRDILKKELVFQHIKVIYPTAPSRPYTPMKGALSNVWFDRYKISNDCPEHLESIDSMSQILSSLVDEEVKAGISKDKIIIGGFSMGGAMAMHLAYRYNQQVAGVFALSSFLTKDSIVYQVLQNCKASLPELYQCQGEADELALYSWGEETNARLKSLGVTATFHSFPDLHHEMCRTELENLKIWILKKLPLDTH
ncbi:lysophospholipase-like protein 1 [Latimeria chalumnae]|uniref:Lysophospholipase-like protein 1 n=1 Tax=Latimeria chalumnae TaxID=7897 RepID=H3A7T1_LATCH|nr:PREDICTED: lysophospholipase-like protein 1 [Latimeria chalumnae]|eukprot:XP_005998463.1 PREDICTED: lysophospholipase-like protein 1 [Latimeria chalumnae]